MGIRIDNISFDEAVEKCCKIAGGQTTGHYVVTPNVDHIVRLETDTALREAYENADLVLTDGKPLLWISNAYKTPIKEKISGSDLFPKLCENAADMGLTMFFFGAMPGVADAAAVNLIKKYPGLKVVGTLSPSYGFEKNEGEVDAAIAAINEARPDILIIALGCPKQELFAYQYRNRLNVKLSLGLGASLDFEAGTVKRAPKFMSDHGLEWLYRITQDPARLAKRYLIDMVHILPLAVKHRKKD